MKVLLAVIVLVSACGSNKSETAALVPAVAETVVEVTLTNTTTCRKRLLPASIPHFAGDAGGVSLTYTISQYSDKSQTVYAEAKSGELVNSSTQKWTDQQLGSSVSSSKYFIFDVASGSDPNGGWSFVKAAAGPYEGQWLASYMDNDTSTLDFAFVTGECVTE